MWWEVITEALLDTLKLFPFLFLLYILIELMEHNTRIGKPNGVLTGKAAPFLGAATGLIPMCGFSVMAAKLYEHKHVTLGVLLSVFISTSDEAFFVLLTAPQLGWLDKLVSVLVLCGVKIVLGAAVGYLVDAVVKRAQKPLPGIELLEEHMHEEEEEHMHEHAHGGEHGGDCDREHMHEGEYTVCEHKEGHGGTLSLYFVSPLLHSLKIAAFILAFNLAFGYLVFGIGGGNAELGEERVITFLQGAGYWYQPLVCSLIALIPNCVSSVAITEAYALGSIAFGGFLGGLITNAGLGYLILFRKGGKWKKALAIMLFLFALGVAVGYAGNAICLAL